MAKFYLYKKQMGQAGKIAEWECGHAIARGVAQQMSPSVRFINGKISKMDQLRFAHLRVVNLSYGTRSKE